jgi:hypothetical protein
MSYLDLFLLRRVNNMEVLDDSMEPGAETNGMKDNTCTAQKSSTF